VGGLVANARLFPDRYHLLQHEGVFVGPSAALNVVGAVRLAEKLGPGHTIVTVLCDGGDRLVENPFLHTLPQTFFFFKEKISLYVRDVTYTL
jgi:hypothetical protein